MGDVIRGPWGGAAPTAPPAPGGPLASLWADPGCPAPSPGQADLIHELMAEISREVAWRQGEPIRDPAAWLRGAAGQQGEGWPPSDWQAVIRLLKSKLKQMRAIRQRKARDARRAAAGKISPAQKRMIWALIRKHPYCDEDWLYAWIGQNFPQARREKDGKKAPSVSALSQSEAGRIIDHLEGRG